jgi:putative transposase
MIETVREAGPQLGIAPTCAAFGLPTATYYRRSKPKAAVRPPRPTPPRALPEAERTAVLEVLHEPRFVDLAPAPIWAQLLDEGRYLCSQRTMYRILEQNQEVRERRKQLRHPRYAAPELLAEAPNRVWSWDITKLLGPVKWTYFYLYVILDIFSRYVVGWMVARNEAAWLARILIEESCRRQRINSDELILHADRGSAMISKSVALLLADLGVTKSHSRPYVSNDNPFSEAQFKTMKYRPQFPDRFGSLHDARSFCAEFFRWYNTEHRHSGIGLLTPDVVHHGLAEQCVAARSDVLSAAFAAHPERFVAGTPRPPGRPTAVWINPPKRALVEPIRAPQVDREQNFAFTAPHSPAADSIHIQVSPQNDTRWLVETVDAQSNTAKIIAHNTEDSALNSDDPLSHFH